NFPHEIETTLTGRTEKIKHKVLVNRNAPKVHGDGGLRFDSAGLVGNFALGANDGDFADAADEFGFASSKRSGHDHFDGLQKWIVKGRRIELAPRPDRFSTRMRMRRVCGVRHARDELDVRRRNLSGLILTTANPVNDT